MPGRMSFGVYCKICALTSSLFLEIHKVFLRKRAFVRTHIFLYPPSLPCPAHALGKGRTKRFSHSGHCPAGPYFLCEKPAFIHLTVLAGRCGHRPLQCKINTPHHSPGSGAVQFAPTLRPRRTSHMVGQFLVYACRGGACPSRKKTCRKRANTIRPYICLPGSSGTS